MTLSPRDALLLQRIVEGELDPESDSVRRRTSESPELAGAIDDWRHVAASIERTAELDRELAAEAGRGVSELDRRQVAEALEPMHGRGPSAWWKPVAAIAAALLLVLLVPQFLGNDGPRVRPTGPLSADRCLAPRQAVSSFTPFVVDVELDTLWQLEISVYDDGGVELLRSPRLDDTRWDLTPEEIERLRGVEEIRWTFDVFDAGGTLRSSGGPCRAWRSH